MTANERYFIGPGLRAKLREIIHRVDGLPVGGGGGDIPTRLQDMRHGGGESIRLGTISSSWLKGTEATVTQFKGDGSAISPTVTFTAKNHFVDISVDCGPKKVACANVGGTWILIAAEC